MNTQNLHQTYELSRIIHNLYSIEDERDIPGIPPAQQKNWQAARKNSHPKEGYLVYAGQGVNSFQAYEEGDDVSCVDDIVIGVIEKKMFPILVVNNRVVHSE